MKKLEKKCRVCSEGDPSKLRKLISSKGKISLDKLCRDCFNKIRRERHEKNKEKDNERRREYYQDNKDAILQQNANWRDENRDKWLEGRKAYYANNAETILAQYKEKYSTDEEFRIKKIEAAKEWETNNSGRVKKRRKKYYTENKVIWENQRKKPKYKSNRKIYRKRKYETDIQYKLRQDISVSIVKGLKRRNSSKKGNSCLQFLPYSIDELKIHLESLFESWMTWNNRGVYDPKIWNDSDPTTWTWQIDHIIPHSTFDYTSMEDQAFKDCWALSNLRPLSAKQNIIDGNRR